MKNVQQTQARELYFQAQMTHQQIAELLDLNRKTVGLWIQQGKWQQMRIAAQQTPGIILQDLYNQLSILNDAIHQRGGIPTLEESVIQRRLIMSIKSFGQQSASNYMQVYTELINHITKQDPSLATQVVKHANEVVKQKVNNNKCYQPQDMFVDDDDIDINIDDEPKEQPDGDVKQQECAANETFCYISENDNNTENKEEQPNETSKTTEENISENETSAPKSTVPIYQPALSTGIIWLGDGMIYDPVIGKKREITFSEDAAFKAMGFPPGTFLN